VAQLAAYREPWSVNGPALSVALACLEDAAFPAKTERWLEQERAFLLQRLMKLDGFHPFSSRTNFLLVRMDKRRGDALQLRAFLLRKKILIRACNSFAELGGDFFRVAVRRRKDNRRLLGALSEWTHLK
jgi:threonine-phosphate decarboxylase